MSIMREKQFVTFGLSGGSRLHSRYKEDSSMSMSKEQGDPVMKSEFKATFVQCDCCTQPTPTKQPFE